MNEEEFLPQYQGLAARTFKRSSIQGVDGIHMASGLCTEIQLELQAAGENDDLANIKEEIGDAFWYTAGLCTMYGFNFARMVKMATILEYEIENVRTTAVLELLDIYKAELIYGKAADIIHVQMLILEVIKYLGAVIVEEELDLADVLRTNIRKLQARFPDKFSTEKALNRDLQKEREILEGK